MKINIKYFVLFVSPGDIKWPITRQFPNKNLQWENVQFVITNFLTDEILNTNNFDYVIITGAVFHRPFTKNLKRYLRREQLIYIHQEPKPIVTLSKKFLEQFGTIITTDQTIKHPNMIFQFIAIPWWVGIYNQNGTYRKRPRDLQDFESWEPKKTKLISMIISNNTSPLGSLFRYEFAKILKKKLGNQIDFFGKGHNPITDKEEGLRDYRYHITLENSYYTDYWTEKFSDPILSLSYPIYAGCPNLDSYFSKKSFMRISLLRPRYSIEKIQKLISSDTDKESLTILKQERKKILYEYNIFSLITKLITNQRVQELKKTTWGNKNIHLKSNDQISNDDFFFNLTKFRKWWSRFLIKRILYKSCKELLKLLYYTYFWIESGIFFLLKNK